MNERLVPGSRIDDLLDRLYAANASQDEALGSYFSARANFEEAGLSEFVDLREGDLRMTLKNVNAPVDFMLDDIWTPMARPALELAAPSLRDGAVVICDNTAQFRDAYRDYFVFVHDPANRLRTMTLPFEGGLEFTVRGD